MSEPRELRTPPPKPKPPKAKPSKPAPSPAPTPYAPGGAAVPGYHQPSPTPVRDITGPASYTPYRAPEPIRRYQPNPTGPISRATQASFIASQPTPRQRAADILGINTSIRKPPPPPPSYLQKHPYIAREIRDARGYMDEFEFDNFMSEKLEEYYGWDNERFKNRLARKEQHIRDYYAEAQKQQGLGDLDYTEENPINPRWLNHPGLTSQGTPSALRREMYDRLRGLDPSSDEAAAIRKLYQGDTYNKGLMDLAAIGSGGRYDVIKYHEEQLKKTKGYQANALTKSEGYFESRMAKYEADMKKYEESDGAEKGWVKPVMPTDPHESGLNLFSTDPRDNPLFAKKNASPYEKRLMLKQLTEGIQSGDYDRQREQLATGMGNLPFFGTYQPGQRSAASETKKKEQRPSINVIGSSDEPPPVDAGGNPIGGEPQGGSRYYSDFQGHSGAGKNYFHEYIENPTGEGLLTILDKLARPLSAVSAGAQYINAQDEDKDFSRHTIYGKFFGKDLANSYDDLNLGDLGGFAKAVGTGFWGEGKGILENQEHLQSFDDVIHRNAEADPELNIYDNHSYQTWAGLGADLVLDPINYVGIGAVTGAAALGRKGASIPRDIVAAKAYKDSLAPMTKSVDEFIESAGLANWADAREAKEIIQGKGPMPRTTAEKVLHVQRVRVAVENLGKMAAHNSASSERIGHALRDAKAAEATEMASRRKVVLEEAGLDVVRSELENFVVQQVEAGHLTKDALTRYDPDFMLSSMTVAEKLPQIESRMSYWGSVAKHMDDIYNEQGMLTGYSGPRKIDGEVEPGVSTGGPGERPNLVNRTRDPKTYSHHTAEAQYVEKLKADRDTLEQSFGTREWSEAQRKQIQELEDKIVRAEEKLDDTHGVTEKGSFLKFMRAGDRIRAKGENHPDWQRFEAIRKEAELRAQKEGARKPNGSFEGILGPEIFADPTLKKDDIWFALSRSRSAIYKNEDLVKVKDALKARRGRIKDQASRLKGAKQRGDTKEIARLQKSHDDAVLAANAAERIIHQAQAAHFVTNINRAKRLKGKQTLATTDRGEKLAALLKEVEKRLDKASGRAVGRKSAPEDAPLDPRYDVDTDIANRRASRFEGGKDAEVMARKAAEKDERKTSEARLDSESEGSTGRENWPKEFLNPEDNSFNENVFDVPAGIYNDEQYYQYMYDTIKRQIDETDRDSWRSISDGINLGNTPPALLDDSGNIDEKMFDRVMDFNPYTGVWKRKTNTSQPEWDEWLDSVANTLNTEYHGKRTNITRREKRKLEDVVKDQARDEFELMMTKNVEKLRGMFARHDGSLIDDEDSLRHLIDSEGNKDQLYPYIMLPGEPGRVYMVGREATNRHLTALKDEYPQQVRDAKNGLAVIDELKAGVKKTGKFRKGVEGTQMHQPGIETRLNFLREHLTEAGMHFSGDAKQDIDYILKHEATARAAFDLPAQITNHLFKETHGMTLHEAKQIKERTLLKTVSSLSPGWTAHHGENMTMHEFVSHALANEDSFQKVMAAGPFKFRKTAGAKSEKEARAIYRKGKWENPSPWTSPKGAELSEKWAKENWAALQKHSHAERVRIMEDLYTSTRRKMKKTAAERKAQYVKEQLKQAREEGKVDLSKETTRKTTQEAKKDTIEWLNWAIKSDQLAKQVKSQGLSAKTVLKRDTGVGSSDADLLKYAEKHMTKDKLDEIKAQKAKVESATANEVADINARIKELEGELNDIRTSYRSFNDQRQKARTIYEKELTVEAIQRAARIPMARADKAFAVSLFGTQHAVPSSRALFRAVEKASEAPVGKQIASAWQHSFRSPSKGIEFDMAGMRGKQMGMTPAIIKRDVERLAKVWDEIPPEIRKAEFKKIKNGLRLKHLKGTPVGDALDHTLRELLPYFREEIPAGRPNDFITRSDINRYLQNTPFRINHRLANRSGIKTPDDLLYAILNNYDEAGNLYKKTDKALDDPMEMLWQLKVATNLAASDKALKYSISKFGIWRGMENVSGDLKKVDGYTPEHAVVEDLDKEAGWVTIPEVDGGTHYYPPETAQGIRNLMKMVEPGSKEHNMFLKMTDRATDIWKAANTIPVPSYWTSNQIGEMMASWLDGVWSHVPYQRAWKVVAHGRTEESAMSEAMNSFNPMATFDGLTDAQRTVGGKDVLFEMHNGEKVTVERANVAYHESGLATSFFNTEFKRSGAGGKIRSSKIGKLIPKGWNKSRQLGENHETWLRMSHFLDVLAKAPKHMTFEQAVADAASRVRKFHFDYTDVTPFEKSTMVRVFPFYKWTRKAAPLMMSQLFVNPGKMVAYPKVANAASAELTSNDFHEDTNGYMPNFTGIAPMWLTDLFAFQTTSDNADGMFNAFKIPNPGIDGMNTAVNPMRKGIGLLNPLLKGPIEQAMGGPLHNPWEDKRIAYNPPLENKDDRIRHLVRQGGSWGNLASKYGNIKKDDLISISGLGDYEDNYFQH